MNQEGETDIEALQAQIDLSNSVAFDIVSSWMKPSPSSSKPVQQQQQQPVIPRTTARDLEEFARRPPRLGLGATVSKSTTVTAQEAAKLKGKLSKKPIRGDNNDIAAVDGGEEEEEESRNTVISQRKSTTVGLNKRVIDVFSSTSNKKRKRSNSHSEGSTLNKKTDLTGTAVNPTSTTLLAPPAHISKSKKRKDKGKNKLHQEQQQEDTSVSHLFDEEWTGFSEEVYDGVVVPDGPPSTPSPPPSQSSSKSPTRRVSSLSPISRPTLYRGFSVDHQKISLLNLHGPPPPPVEEGDRSSTVGSSDKKKRRRKRKKRKTDQALEGAGDT